MLSLAVQCIVIDPVCVCLFVGLLPQYLEIACIDLHQTGSVGEGSDISIWLNFGDPAPPGRGSVAGLNFLAAPYYSQCAVFASLGTFFIACCTVFKDLWTSLLHCCCTVYPFRAMTRSVGCQEWLPVCKKILCNHNSWRLFEEPWGSRPDLSNTKCVSFCRHSRLVVA